MIFTKENAVAELQRVAKKLNQDHFSQSEYNKYSKISVYITKQLFDGSWNAAVKAAGLKTYRRRFTKENAVAELQRVAKILNQDHFIISDYEKYSKISNTTVSRLFDGSWNEAIEAAGLKSYRRRFTKEEAVAELQRIAKILNRNYLSQSEFNKYSKIPTTFKNWFFDGSWKLALESAGLNTYRKKPTKEEAIAELQRVAKMLNPNVLFQSEFNKSSKISVHITKQLFDGSWNAALEAAGLKQYRKKRFTREEAIAEIKRVANLLGQDYLTNSDYNKYSKISINITRRFFDGSWNKAVETAGLKPTRRRITREEAIAEIQRIAKILNQNHLSHSVYEKYSKIPIGNINQFGRWNVMIKAAGLIPSYKRRTVPDDEAFKRMLEIFNKHQQIICLEKYKKEKKPNHNTTMRRRHKSWANVLEIFYEWLIDQKDIKIKFNINDLLPPPSKTSI